MGIKDPPVASSPAAQVAPAAASASVPAPPAEKTAAAVAATGDAKNDPVNVAAPAESPAASVNSGKGPVAARQGGRVPAPAEKAQDEGKAATATVGAAPTASTPAFLPFQVGERRCFVIGEGGNSS